MIQCTIIRDFDRYLSLPTRSRPHMAHRDGSQAALLSAFGGHADIPQTARTAQSVVGD
jgi:hypothetical protein